MTVIVEKENGTGKGNGMLPQQLQRRSLLCMVLLTLQYGAQPLLTQHFSGYFHQFGLLIFGAPGAAALTIGWFLCSGCLENALLAQVFGALAAIAWEGTLSRMKQEWSFIDAMRGSALPAIIYAVQNSLVQVSYRHLDSLTATMLNQTKLAFTAFFMFLILGHRQSKQQIGALMLLLVAATLLSLSQKSSKTNAVVYQNSFMLGVVPVLIASVLSGLASTLCQWAVQVKKRSTYLMTIEMSGIGSLCLFASLSQSPDGDAIRKKGFFFGWTPLTVLPVVTNAVGGILVGLVTMYAGGVKKGFVIVSALLVTALLQVLVDGVMPSWLVFAALPLVVTSTIIHQKYPYKPKKKAD